MVLVRGEARREANLEDGEAFVRQPPVAHLRVWGYMPRGNDHVSFGSPSPVRAAPLWVRVGRDMRGWKIPQHVDAWDANP